MVQFLISKGLADKKTDVSLAALAAGRDVMQQYGEEALGPVIKILEVPALLLAV